MGWDAKGERNKWLKDVR